ncbi:MAG: type IX secretion system membrane protein PorP/SprF [Crocinitomicaceae bacterium]
MKRIILIPIILFSCIVYGQQLPQYTQYMFNHYAFNPAYAGVNKYWEGTSVNRYQWIGITDAPRTFTLSAHGPLKNEKIGLGGYVYTDVVGPTRRIGFQSSFTYHVKLTDGLDLSFGLSVGFNQWLLDADKITTYHDNDFYFSNGLLKSFDPDAKFGLWLYHDDWYFGASIGQMFHNKLSFLETQTGSESFMEDHFYFTGGYTFKIGDDWAIEPTTLLKLGLPAPVKLDVNVRGIYKESVWLGFGWRSNDAITTMVGYTYKKMLSIGYAFDISTTQLKSFNTGTHELMLGIKFGSGRSTPTDQPSLE